MKNTFHSSGTASGNVEMMKVCSIQMDTMAIHVAHPHGENSSTNGMMSSQVVPPIWASRCVVRAGRMSRG